jgi:pimeloyl-ACP methyl ester carboxylesterase
MFYREAGSKDLPTIVLLHGFPSSSHMFRDMIPQLSDKFHVIAPDYIGFGYSDAPAVNEFEYTFDNLADHVEEFLFKALGLKKFIIYVQDYGAPVGYRIAFKTRTPSRALSCRMETLTPEGSAAGLTR